MNQERLELIAEKSSTFAFVYDCVNRGDVKITEQYRRALCKIIENAKEQYPDDTTKENKVSLCYGVDCRNCIFHSRAFDLSIPCEVPWDDEDVTNRDVVEYLELLISYKDCDDTKILDTYEINQEIREIEKEIEELTNKLAQLKEMKHFVSKLNKLGYDVIKKEL